MVDRSAALEIVRAFLLNNMSQISIKQKLSLLIRENKRLLNEIDMLKGDHSKYVPVSKVKNMREQLTSLLKKNRFYKNEVNYLRKELDKERGLNEQK